MTNQLSPLSNTQYVKEIVDSLNENSNLTNFIYNLVKNVGDINSLNSNETLENTINKLYGDVGVLKQNSGVEIGFLSNDPDTNVPKSDLVNIYVNTTTQRLMILNHGDLMYYPVFGENSTNTSLNPAPEYVVTPPPTVTPPVTNPSGLWSPNPKMNELEIRLEYQFSQSNSIQSAITIGDTTYIAFKNGDKTDLYIYDVVGSTLNLISTIPLKLEKFYMIDGANTNILMVGGFVGGETNSKIYSYDYVNDVLTETTTTLPNNFVLGDFGYNADFSKAFLLGHYFDSPSPIPNEFIHELNLDTFEFTPNVAELNVKLFGAKINKFTKNDNLYIVGGRNSNDGSNNSLVKEIYEFNTLSKDINVVGMIPEGISDGELFMGSNDLYYIGGFSAGLNNCIKNTNKIFKISNVNGTWVTSVAGFIPATPLRIFGSEIVDSCYSTLIYDTIYENGTIFLMGIE